MVIFFAGCGSTSQGEEILDTLLLVARNVLQFVRLASVMRQYVYYIVHTWLLRLTHLMVTCRSGQSIFSRPKPIDLTAARRAGFSLDIDLEGDEEERGELSRPLIRDPVVFDASSTPMPRAVQAAQERDEEDVWAELG